jgi:cardiolipin synthase
MTWAQRVIVERLGARAQMIEWIGSHFVLASTVFVVVAAVVAGIHALLSKSDVRAAIGWVGLIVLVPLVGTVLYYLIGINRIRRRAVALRREAEEDRENSWPGESLIPGDIVRLLKANDEAVELAHLMGNVTSRTLLAGNLVEPLINGDEAYPAMVAAIRDAETSVVLLTYIFDHDSAGKEFMEALVDAKSRGVDVRVLIDDVGSQYSRPRVSRLLKREGVRVASFLPMFSARVPSFNLRNHRKIMVVDGHIGFTGGMNIRENFVLSNGPKHPGMDLHFRLQGPVVAHLRDTFAEDWEFTTGESLEGDAWNPTIASAGNTIARGVADGPDADVDVLNFTLLGAIACASRSIRIVTPYFLPDTPLVYALNTAALSGLDVDIVVPENGNLRLVNWAMWGQIDQVLGHGCRVWLSPRTPFDHTKLMIVDDYWVLFGSTNWDPRSLRLNFEFNVECYDRNLAAQMRGLVVERIRRARRLTKTEVDRRNLPTRLRDGAARLLTPYL